MNIGKNLLPEQLADLRSLYERFENFDGYALNRANFDMFSKNGGRLSYEKEYFARRGCLISRAMTHLVYGGHKNELEKIISAVCDEFTWALPAHIGDSKTPETVIDLFNAETAQTLSEICSAADISEELKERVTSEITRRVIEPYENGTFAWESANHNWAAVCGGCVGMTYMTAFPERFPAVRDRLLGTMECFLSGYGDDGICLEGADYWSYGFGYFLFFAEMLERFDGTNLLDNEKVCKIAQCGQNVILRKNIVMSFSDCSRETGFNFGMMCFLKKRFGGAIELPDALYRRDYDGCFRWAAYYRSFIWADASLVADKPRAGAVYFPSAEWYADRRGRFSFAAKGGNNSEPHNHNDIGAFIIAGDGGQLITDPGAGEYTADYFGDKRYEYFHTSSLGHSVPIIDGAAQGAGKAVSEADGGVFSVEMSDVYGAAGLIKALRSFSVTDNGVTITDRFSFDKGGHKIIERLVSPIKPVLRDGGAIINSLTVRSDFSEPLITAHEVKNHDGASETFYTVDFTLFSSDPECAATVICAFTDFVSREK